MTRTICEREDHTSAAVFSGTINAEITSHARECPVCADILLVARFLRGDDSLAAGESTALPYADAIWHKAQLRATQETVRLALRPIRFMKIIAIVTFLSLPWLRSLLPVGRELFSSWTRNLDFNLVLSPRIWLATTTQLTILLGFAAATILLSVSSWYLVRQE
jgi:hypothetical protein